MGKQSNLMYVLIPTASTIGTGTPEKQAPLAAASVNGGEQGLLLVGLTALSGGGLGFPVSLLGLDDNTDNVAPLDGSSTPLYQGVVARLTGYDAAGNNWDRLRSGSDSVDAQAVGIGHLSVLAHGLLFNGATWDRNRSLSAANLAAFLGIGGLISAGPGQWTANDAPAVGVRATVTRAAGGAGVRHVCTSVSGAFRNLVGAVESGELQLRDGATGAGTILWRCRWINGVTPVIPSGLNIVGSANTAMTLEFLAAPTNAGNDQSVAMTGYDIS